MGGLHGGFGTVAVAAEGEGGVVDVRDAAQFGGGDDVQVLFGARGGGEGGAGDEEELFDARGWRG